MIYHECDIFLFLIPIISIHDPKVKSVNPHKSVNAFMNSSPFKFVIPYLINTESKFWNLGPWLFQFPMSVDLGSRIAAFA
jgi:hypothetical protein